MEEPKSDLLLMMSVRQRKSGQLELRVSDAAGKWQSWSLERYTSIGWHEAVVIAKLLRNDIEGDSQLPF
jgi:hypothetical protein